MVDQPDELALASAVTGQPPTGSPGCGVSVTAATGVGLNSNAPRSAKVTGPAPLSARSGSSLGASPSWSVGCQPGAAVLAESSAGESSAGGRDASARGSAWMSCCPCPEAARKSASVACGPCQAYGNSPEVGW